MPDEFRFDVFLSHSAKDKLIVKEIAERLKSEGLRVWFDSWEIKPGDNIPAKIEEGLEVSRILVLCMSINAFGSEWAQLEANTFRFRDPLNKERRFIPLRLDDTQIKSALAQFLYISWLPSDRELAYAKLVEVSRFVPPAVRGAAPAHDPVRNSLNTLPNTAHWAEACVLDGIEEIENLFSKKGRISTGLSNLDSLIHGVHPGQMIVIASPPSMGKTVLGMNIVEYVAVDSNIPVVCFSLETRSSSLTQRMLCSRAKVNMRRVRDGFLSEKDFPALVLAASQIAKSPLLIDDASNLTLQELSQRLRFYVGTHGIKLAAIDHLHLLQSGDGGARGSNQDEISAISAGIKTLATELQIPIIVLVKLRNDRSRRSKLSDLDSIELDADVVGLLVREEYYADSDDEMEDVRNNASLIIAKHRDGPTGEVLLTFIKEHSRFVIRDQTANV